MEQHFAEEEMPFYSLHIKRFTSLEGSNVQKVFASPTPSLPLFTYSGDSPNSPVPRVSLDK